MEVSSTSFGPWAAWPIMRVSLLFLALFFPFLLLSYHIIVVLGVFVVYIARVIGKNGVYGTRRGGITIQCSCMLRGRRNE